MRIFLFLILSLYSVSTFAISCDCDVWVFSPMTGSHQMAPATIKTYQLESYASRSAKAQASCQNSCLSTFSEDMKDNRLKSLLLLYTQRLIEQRALGFTCTGLSTYQYPVVVKARLGTLSLGNVHRSLEVITHEEACFY